MRVALRPIKYLTLPAWLVLVSFLATPAAATNIVWSNPGNGNWHTPSNWSPPQVPGPSDVANIVATGTYTVSIFSDVNVGAINLGGTGGTRFLRVNDATVTTTAGIQVGSVGELNLLSGTVSGGEIGLTGALVSSGTSFINCTLTPSGLSSITVRGPSLTVANSFTNRGILLFAGPDLPTLTLTSGTLTNNPSGTISTIVYATLDGELNNLGSINATQGLALTRAGANHQNSGSITVPGTGDFDCVGASASFSTSGNMSVSHPAAIYMDCDIFVMSGGSISGTGMLWMNTSVAASFATNPTNGILYLTGQGISLPQPLLNDTQQVGFGVGAQVTAPSLTNAPGRQLDLLGTFQLNAPTFTNYGTVIFENGLDMPGGELYNAPGGTLELDKALAPSVLVCELNNQGTMNIAYSLELDLPGAEHLNLGTITGGPLVVKGAGLSHNAGSIWWVDARSSTINISSPASVTELLGGYSVVNINGPFNTAGTSLFLDHSFLGCTQFTNGAGRYTQIVHSAVEAASVVNLGTLSIAGTTSLAGSLDNQGLMTIADGMTLDFAGADHANSGTIQVNGGTFTITQTGTTPSFTNSGTLRVVTGATARPSGGTFLNDLTGLLAGGGTLDMSGTTFINNGTIDPGASPGLLTITGNVTFGSTSVLNMELGGLTAGTQYDAIQISGNAVLNGTLNVSLVNGFFPQPGNAFDLVTCGSHTGQFTNVNGTSVGFGNQLAFLSQPQASEPIRLTTITQSWSSLSGSGITARSHHSAVYTGVTNRLIVFGGYRPGGEQNDTWVLESANGTGGGFWSNLDPAGTPPPPRYDHAAAYDAVNNRMIVYGGFSDFPPYGFSDVWVLSNANGLGGTPTWTQLSPGGGTPGLRGGSDVAYNPASNRLILFGGVHPDDACTFASNDIWILSNANGLGGTPVWTLLPTSGLPPFPRSGAVMGYDSATNGLVLHGGTDACASTLAEVRTLTHADGLGGTPTWTTLPLTNPTPPVRTEHAGIYDASTDRLITFGGLDAIMDPLEDVFVVMEPMIAVSSGWTSLPVPTGSHPAPRFGHSLSWDPLSRRVIVFGGESGFGNYYSDTWNLDLNLDGGPVSGVTDPVPPAPTPNPGGDITHVGFMKAPTPNPTNGPMSLTFGVPSAAEVTVEVFDVSGRPVRRLFEGIAEEGRHEISWNGEGDRGPVASGIYYVVLRSGNDRDTRRIAVTR